jgi:hypothetical protein
MRRSIEPEPVGFAGTDLPARGVAAEGVAGARGGPVTCMGRFTAGLRSVPVPSQLESGRRSRRRDGLVGPIFLALDEVPVGGQDQGRVLMAEALGDLDHRPPGGQQHARVVVAQVVRRRRVRHTWGGPDRPLERLGAVVGVRVRTAVAGS